jgi:hypothetical protein
LERIISLYCFIIVDCFVSSFYYDLGVAECLKIEEILRGTSNFKLNKKMKFKTTIMIILIGFFIWGLTGDLPKETENKPIKKITETSGLCFGGRRNVWTIRKSEQIFNPKGQLIEYNFYGRNILRSKILYTYNDFDSLIRTEHFDSTLKIEEIETYTYNAQKKHLTDIYYKINTISGDTNITEKTTWYYDALGRRYKKRIETDEYYVGTPHNPTHTRVKIDVFNSQGLIIRDTFYSIRDTMTSTDITEYLYDEKNNRIAKFGSDSIYYKRNEKGQITEEYLKDKDYSRIKAQYHYDERGNKIKTLLNIDDGFLYEFVYDKNNKLVKEYRPDSFLLLFQFCVIYDYEFY